jgi:hypothetical protein
MRKSSVRACMSWLLYASSGGQKKTASRAGGFLSGLGDLVQIECNPSASGFGYRK